MTRVAAQRRDRAPARDAWIHPSMSLIESRASSVLCCVFVPTSLSSGETSACLHDGVVCAKHCFSTRARNTERTSCTFCVSGLVAAESGGRTCSLKKRGAEDGGQHLRRDCGDGARTFLLEQLSSVRSDVRLPWRRSCDRP